MEDILTTENIELNKQVSMLVEQNKRYLIKIDKLETDMKNIKKMLGLLIGNSVEKGSSKTKTKGRSRKEPNLFDYLNEDDFPF